ncbi:hypothetical protein ABBQ32_012847 [Trebouxia sp. C0010 RCD-2024]
MNGFLPPNLCRTALPCKRYIMGLASQLQQFQQQQPQQGSQPGGGFGQASQGAPQWQQPYPNTTSSQQGQNQQYSGAPQSQSAFPSIPQQWQQRQQPGMPGQSAPQYPAHQGGYPNSGPQQAFAGSNQEYQGYVTSKLQQMVTTNRLQAFYPPQRLQQLVNKVLQVDLRSIGSKWNMPMELAFDLCTLALYDIAIYADDSTSMKFAEGGERIKDLKAILSRVCEVATLFDDDGLSVRFMNSKLEGNHVKTSSEASALVDRVKFEGMTPLGTNLDAKIVQPLFAALVQRNCLPKPVLVIAITDGEPTGEPVDRVVQVIKNAKAVASQSPYGPGSIAFEFAQVGKDAAAQAFLARLDKHPDVGKMIDATSYFELEQEEYKRKGINLTPDVWLVKLMVGAIDPSFDEQD